MFKTYQKYIIHNFISKFFLITLIFFSLIIIMGSLDEVSFTKDLDIHFLTPYFINDMIIIPQKRSLVNRLLRFVTICYERVI